MKTTLDLPDDLLIKAKTLAAQRKTTLKAIVESALRSALRPPAEMENPDPEKYELDPLGFLVMKRRPDAKPLTSEDVQRMIEECDEEDFQRAMKLREGK
jgi:integrase